MRLSMLLALSAGLLAGCAPHDAELTDARYLAYFASATSQNLIYLQNDGLDLSADDVRADLGLTPIDCRQLSEELEGQRLAGVDYETECTFIPEGGGDPEPIYTNWYWWLNYYSYYLKEDTIDPWRVEVVQTTEGDLQLTAHVNVGKFGDFRFGWVIDPYFQPTECVDNGDGTASEVAIDGDWVQAWSDSSREGTGSFFHLNAYAYQLNPADSATYWSFPEDWYAGYTFGRYGDEDLYGHQLDYLDNWTGAPLYFLVGGQAIPAQRFQTYEEWVTRWDEKFAGEALDGSGEFNDLMTLGKATTPFDVRMENNSWRIADEAEAALEESNNYAYGLENWVGVSPAWVRFDQDPATLRALEPGVLDSPLTGSFAVYIEPLDSASKFFVTGKFSIDRIRKDVWGYQRTLDEIKRDENNTPKCGEDRLTTDAE